MVGMKSLVGGILLAGAGLWAMPKTTYVPETGARVESMGVVRHDGRSFAKFISDNGGDREAYIVHQYHWPVFLTVGCPYHDRDPSEEEKKLFRDTGAAYQKMQ
mgnify:CR=1 FL=1